LFRGFELSGQIPVNIERKSMELPARVDFTSPAGELLLKLTQANGPLMFHQSGGCCDGSAPMCYLDGEFTIKRIVIEKGTCWLVPANKDYQALEVQEHNDFQVWGIVTYVIKSMRNVCVD